MATVIVHRAKPFERGDMSIGIYVDGKASGTLLSNNEISIKVPAGRHELRAFSNGGRGKKYLLSISDGEALHVQVHPVAPLKTPWWDTVPLLVIIAMPDRLFGKHGFIVQMGLWAICLAISLTIFIAFRLPYLRNMLRIEPMPYEAASKMQIAVG